ncbi:hypothetical protein LTR15_003278 [Elasticomyces elasticus]|nr:hypothetical protein LTR15_003278 [Elasticomyces elasticus]
MATRPCPLLDLPPELRNTIWELVLTDNAPGKERTVNIKSDGKVALPSILRTNEQTRRETLPMWYENTHFFMYLWDSTDLQSCYERFAHIGDLAARHIRHVKIRVRLVVRLSKWHANIDLDLGALEAATMVRARTLYESARFPERVKQELREAAVPLSVKRLKKAITVAHWQALLQAVSEMVLRFVDAEVDTRLAPSAFMPLMTSSFQLTFAVLTPYFTYTAEMANKRCPLLTLPLELRNNIYDMVFEEDRQHHPYININKSGYAVHMHALLHVSKQVRSETMGMWHNINTFTLYNLTPDNGLAQCNLWVDRVSASTLRCVQNIAICMELPFTPRYGAAQLAHTFIIDIDLRAQTVEGMVKWRDSYLDGRRPGPVAFEDFSQQMYTAVKSWQLRTGKRYGTGEWRNLLRAILAVQNCCWMCSFDPDDEEV